MRVSLLLCLALLLTSSLAFAQEPVATPPDASPTREIQLLNNDPPVDYPGAIWTPAAEGNFDLGLRPLVENIDMIIVHDIEGSATTGISIMQRKGSKVTAHYIVDGQGHVFQLVREQNVAWHAGNRDINHRSIGIETEGYAYRPGWYSPQTYEVEARLVRNITQRYNIPRDRTHIIGHFEVPNPRDVTKFGGISGHTDPGPYWDWNTFMTLVRSDSTLVSAEIPTIIRPGEKLPATVTLQNTGDDAWAANMAKNPRTGIQASNPIVFLGTSQGTPSVFSSVSDWISPQYADVLKTADAAPNTSARFDFTLLGPRTLGEVGEELRAIYVPTMAQGGKPIPFGATIPLKLSVVPWDITVSAPDAPIPTEPSPVATWTVKLPIGGIWGVYVTPLKPTKVHRKDVFSFKLRGTEGENGFTIGAKNGGQGQILGGYYSFPTSGSVTVMLEKAPKGVAATNAGSVRFVGPFSTLPTEVPSVTEMVKK